MKQQTLWCIQQGHLLTFPKVYRYLIYSGARRVRKKACFAERKYSVAIFFNWFFLAQQSKLFGVLDSA